jgi:hypothetical protein
MLYYYGLLTVFAIIVYLMVVDPNVSTWIYLQSMNLWVEIKRRYYLITIGAVVKWNNYKLMKEIKKIRKEKNLPDD